MPSNTDEDVVSISIPISNQPEEPILAPMQVISDVQSESTGTQEQPKHPGGRPCEYCKRPEEINKITLQYLESARQAKTNKKPFIPYQQELADNLDIDNDTLYQWTIKKINGSNELEHPEFSGLVKKLNTLKELLLLQRTTGRYNPTGAIFQLKTKHGYIESEKKILLGDKTEPLQIEIVREEVKIHD